MATIKPIEGRSVHQIQSGQVIVDLCSVVKELVENSLDAGATSIEVRFKNSGLDAIEVQDNGNGVAPEDFETLALKHYTSKLSSYDDLNSLQTFGFRGEALSSLCALSTFHVITARASDGSKGTRLDFETSGKLKGKSIVATTKGTAITVEEIFKNLPVRRKELEKNIRREYQKVLHLLNAYACISVGVRFLVSNAAAKGKKNVVFSTHANATTRENIANVFSAKTLLSLLTLELNFELKPSTLPSQSARNWSTPADVGSREIHLAGHISRPVVGEGRQTPDRQMFFVNSRPCALPQVAKAINEVYRSYNVTQSPFIFANLKLDTSSYDVNVSPDKRTILLHDQTALLEALKMSLTELFASHQQSVPQAQFGSRKLPSYKTLTVDQEVPQNKTNDTPPSNTNAGRELRSSSSSLENSSDSALQGPPASIIRRFADRDTEDRKLHEDLVQRKGPISKNKQSLVRNLAVKSGKLNLAEESEEEEEDEDEEEVEEEQGPRSPRSAQEASTSASAARPVHDFNRLLGAAIRKPAYSNDEAENSQISFDPTSELKSGGAKQAKSKADIASTTTNTAGRQQVDKQMSENSSLSNTEDEEPIPSTNPSPAKKTPGVVQNAFDRMRPQRMSAETATVTIGNITTTATIGTPPSKRRRIHTPKFDTNGKPLSQVDPRLFKSLRSFAAPGSHLDDEVEMDDLDLQQSSARLGSNAKRARDSAASSSLLQTESSKIYDSDQDGENSVTIPVLNAEIEPKDGSDDEYIDDEEKKAREEAKVAKMITAAEEAAARPTANNLKRASSVFKTQARKDATLQLLKTVSVSGESITASLIALKNSLSQYTAHNPSNAKREVEGAEDSPEDRLALTVSKPDFTRMRIIGQFNLGFILAIRPQEVISEESSSTHAPGRRSDELFIIDQHASDEKYNFERLQAETVVQNQRLVHPKALDLTAVEEEIILNHPEALAKNGFLIDSDLSGDLAVGRRCRLVSLPMSREVVFDSRDLEELLALLSDQTGSGIPRPSKVRRMFAMRACRSSIMVGKTLTSKQMEKVVKHMGEIDKPWNCPHGRPTMRHLYSLEGWEGWSEGDGLVGMDERLSRSVDWLQYLEAEGVSSGASEEEEDGGD